MSVLYLRDTSYTPDHLEMDVTMPDGVLGRKAGQKKGGRAMQYDFLKQFPRRMKNVGMYATLVQNCVQKTTWKQYGFTTADEQINLVFTVMLYIMEQSLREEACTIDDIGAYIDAVDMQYLDKRLSYGECCQLGDFIVNNILSNEGRVMYFGGFDYEKKDYQVMHISYVANKIIYVDHEIKRTSYYLTDDGYSLLLSTLEIENNMKLSIHEMIFQMHLEKQSYDKAVDEIKHIFNRMRIQMQKIRETMERIRRNALDYSVKDYEEILVEDLGTIEDTRQKFQDYREMVHKRAKELEEENINVKKLSGKDEEKLGYLRVIEIYLDRTIEEHQKILSGHFDLKALYTKELESLSQLSLIKRFSLRTGLYDKILERPQALGDLDHFLRPLFNQDVGKTYNLNKAFQLQRPIRKGKREELEEELDFDEEKWQQEQRARHLEKQRQYQESLGYLLERAAEKGEITLEEISSRVAGTEQERRLLIPNVQIFKEIMVELIRNRRIHIQALQRERRDFIQEAAGGFQLNDMLLKLLDKAPSGQTVTEIEVERLEDGKTVVFEGVRDEDGEQKIVRCSNVRIRLTREGRG